MSPLLLHHVGRRFLLEAIRAALEVVNFGRLGGRTRVLNSDGRVVELRLDRDDDGCGLVPHTEMSDWLVNMGRFGKLISLKLESGRDTVQCFSRCVVGLYLSVFRYVFGFLE